MLKLIYIFLGGGVGSMLRYGLAGLVQEFAEKPGRTMTVFPWGTLAVNLLGCFVIGLLWELFEEIPVSAEVRTLLFIGLLGGFTTFSAYALETRHLLRDGQWLMASLNVLLSSGLGVAMVLAGVVVSRKFIGLFR